MTTADFLARGQRAALLAIAVLVPAIAAAQATIQYDAQVSRNQETMEILYGQTVECMRGMTQAALQQGEHEHKALMRTNMKFCGRPLYLHLVITMGWESKDAAGLLLATSDLSIKSFSNRSK